MKEPDVLVVDSNPEIFVAVGRMLDYFQVKADFRTCAASALDRLKNAHYSTLIIAIDLPDMAGVEFASQAHVIDPDLNIVLFIAKSYEQILKIVLEPTVSVISKESVKTCEFGDMLLDVKYRETGKVFLLE